MSKAKPILNISSDRPPEGPMKQGYCPPINVNQGAAQSPACCSADTSQAAVAKALGRR